MRTEKCLYSWKMTINSHVVPRIENQQNGRFPGVPVPLNCYEYAWTPPVTGFHFPPHDMVPGFWQWEPDTFDNLVWQSRGIIWYHCIMLLTMPTHKALYFLLMSRAKPSQYTESKTQIMAKIKVKGKQWYLLQSYCCSLVSWAW